MSLPDLLDADAVALAWERCAQANPTMPPEYAMCPDSAHIADVYARILALNLRRVDTQTLKPATLEALARWLPPRKDAE